MMKNKEFFGFKFDSHKKNSIIFTSKGRKTLVNSYLVEMKAKNKTINWSYKIESQDQITAEKWAEKCLEAGKRDPSKFRIIVTEITKQAASEKTRN